ncbi:MAG: omptin family outer membrane protease [Treponema sp.]|jgi:outer membrane protease|nr:omptin family outer membrane protease [Treponema sp.]
MRSILVPLLFVSIFGLGAQTPHNASQPASRFFDSYTLSSAASFGFLYGQSEEQVYKDAETLLSQLLWDMKPLFYYGSALEFSPQKPIQRWGPFAALSLRFGLPNKTGVMEDRDWMGTGDELTDFSSHDNYTRGATLVDASIGVSMPIASLLVFKTYLAYSYMFFAWCGQDGYGDYTSGHQVFSGAVINFSQMWHITSGGIAVRVPFFDVFSVSAALHAGTVVSYSALDDHLTNGKQFFDTAIGGLLLEPRFEFTWSPVNTLSVALSAGYRHISALKGTSVYRLQGSSSTSSSASQDAGIIGAAYSVWDAGLSLKVRF